MKTLLHKRALPMEWLEWPFKPGHLRVYHDRFKLIVIESVDDVPTLGKQHHVSISSYRPNGRRPNDKERNLVALLFMSQEEPIDEEPAVQEKFVRHLWQPVVAPQEM